ncbi:MAG: hypothetical protein Q8P63_02960 [Candidatus Nealsonbacteria bacterium]|nr:hypothetical protein [Candidatus Nealsonbacteria bacterium]
MLLTPHLLVGAAIIANVQNPILGLILVFLSHYFLDVFPQKEYLIENMKNGRWNKSWPDFLKVFTDIVLGLSVVFLTIGYSPLILVAVFIAISPDGSTLLYFIFPKNKLLAKHRKLHNAINAVCENKKMSPFWGVTSQIAAVAIAIFFLL